MPIGAICATEEVAKAFTPGSHGTTFGGNPISCAASLYVLDRMEKDNISESVKEKGDYFAEKLEALEGVESVRHMGLMIGIVPKEGTAKEIATKCLDEGLLVLTAKDVVRLLPPLTITKDEIDEAVVRFEKAL